MKIYNKHQIQQSINLVNDIEELLATQKQAFIDFFAGVYEVPLPMQLRFDKQAGDCHVKGGFKQGGELFVIKVASGFYKNSVMGLPRGDGALLVFSQKTGLLEAILHDGGWLTTLRTAIAGLIAASVTPWKISNVGIIGTGALARLISVLIKIRYPAANLKIFGRNASKAREIQDDVCVSVKELLAQSDLVFSTTAATTAIINTSDLAVCRPRHIVALGADDVHKQECDPALFAIANQVIVDSKSQASHFGELYHALRQGVTTLDKVVELGDVLKNGEIKNPEFIMTDLTGIAAQDVAIVELVMRGLCG